MPDLTAKRTLVKSPPELWEELSEVERLAKHLGAFGEITITKLEPEHTVAWEGEHASGTVSIEPSGWGTKVTLRAELPEAEEPEASEPEVEPEPEPEPEPEFEPAPEPEPVAAAPAEPGEDLGEEASEEVPRRGFWGWLFRRRTEGAAPEAPVVEPKPEPAAAEVEPVAQEPEPVAAEVESEPVVVEPDPVPQEPAPVVAESEPEPEPAREPEPVEDPALDPERARLILDEALDTLGAAHHRPFSRG
jgi:hypothetical protein